MSDNERSRGDRTRDTRREPRERGGTPNDRRNRSRSPRRDRGGNRRDNNARYRSRSPFRRDEGGRGDRGRGGGGARGRDDRTSTRPDHARARSPPKGPRGPSSIPPPRVSGGKPPSGPRGDVFKREDSLEDTEMKEERQKPEGMDDDEWEMLCTMGFGGFKSTKNTKVPGNNKNYGVRRDKQMEARQYMNRQGGFNRPLSPSHG
ncbi:hypothetical protein NX059_001725 [Plenodomus lindquistii]|nr:hypothetical protein NX059_001725 [Plenodomus lindquistii]